MVSEEYSLLVEEECNEPLPAAEVVDTFEYARFAPLEIVKDGRLDDAVFPLDHAIPDYAAALARTAWFSGYDSRIGDGLPLIREWAEPNVRSRVEEPIRVEVKDIATFLSNPKVSVGRRRLTLDLQPEHVRELTGYGRTLVTTPGEGDRAIVVTVKPPELETSLNATTPRELAVDLTSFLARPVLTREDGRPLRLDADQLRDLITSGSTLVEVPGAGAQAPVRIVAADSGGSVADGGRPVATAISGLVTAESAGGRLTTIEDWRGTHVPASLEPPPVELPPIKFPLMLYLPYRQEWRLLGYSRGDLLNSIPLAPEEETTIEILSWDRRRIEEELTTGEESEFTFEARASRKITGETVNEVQRRNDWRLTAGGRVSLPPIKGITLAGELNTETSSQIQTLNRQTTESITEASAQASAKLRVTRQTKILQVTETGFETRVTRVIRNRNRCRALTFDFFEVLADYRVSTRSLPDQMRLAVLIDDPFAVAFTRAYVLANAGTIRQALLDPDLESGLDAASWLAAREEWCATHCSRVCDCPEPPPASEPSATDSGARGPEAQTGTGLMQSLDAAIDRVLESIRLLRTAGFRSLELAHDRSLKGAAWETAVLEYRRWMHRRYGFEWFNPGFWEACKQYDDDARTITGEQAEAFNKAYEATRRQAPFLPALRIETRTGDRTPERLERLLVSAESAWLETVIRGTFILGVIPGLMPAAMFLDWAKTVGVVNSVRFIPQFGFDDAGLGVHIGQAREAVTRLKNAKDAQAVGPTSGGPSAEVPMKEVAEALPPPPQPFPVDEMARHTVALNALLSHLNANGSHYRMAIWQAMSPADRAARISVYDEVAGMVDNEVLGFISNKVAMPFQAWRVGGLSDLLESIADDLRQNEEPSEREITLITPGITIQGRLDDCDLCEPHMIELQQLEVAERQQALALATEQTRQEQAEAERRLARLESDPPQLDSFIALEVNQ